MPDYSSYIGIVGGGISGLTVGCALRSQGIKTIIFERSKSLNEHGGGISISPNAVKVLDRLNVKEKFISSSSSPEKILIHYKNKKIADIKGDKYFVTSTRQNLLQIMYQRYIELGGEIKFGHEFQGLNQDKIELDFTNNQQYKVSHILGCDGIKSPLREGFFPDSGKPFYSGYNAWRGIGSAELQDGKIYLGNGKHIVIYPANSHGKVSFTAVVKNKNSITDSWRTKGSKHELLEDFKTFNEEIFSMLHSGEEVYKWGIYIRPPLNSFYIKNLTLLGDAAHPMVPFLGQGACMAMEDAYTFGKLAGKFSPDFKTIQNLYETLRLKRTNSIQSQSLLQGKIYHLENPVMVFLRNTFIRYTPSVDYRMKRIWDYDVHNELDKHL